MRSKYFSSRAIARRFATPFLLLCIPAALFAQDNVGEETTIMYPASYFTEFNPVTVQDMLDRIPGVGSATGGSNQNSRGPGQGGGNGGRGLGSGSGGSQVLINGKRTAGKNNQASGQMDRITADQVNYIEIIRGTSGELDVRGSGQIVNVVLFEDLSANSLSYEVNMDRYLDHNTQPGGSVSYSGQTGGLNYVLSAVAEPRYDHNVSKETSILADFALNDEVREERIREQTSYDFSVNLDYELSLKSSVRFNALYSENDNPTDVLRYTTDLRATPRATAIEREEYPGIGTIGKSEAITNTLAKVVIGLRFYLSVIETIAHRRESAMTYLPMVVSRKICFSTSAASPPNASYAVPIRWACSRGRILNLVPNELRRLSTRA